ncbi:MAG: hypothetical protein KKC79_03200 [Gammaproteobacteria bacterium]|nr:hypothetical protein [Gammaproteobacteria bacterium]MBU1443187.1 hypothetical protein [Gammaproteobacteria bacterium]MBU2286827.1 hypothetical protein [Gammaproteobacteria bacterium]MBU2407637.1 hypothetical protein [Gammaproteobacteria bacterium]
MFCFLRRTLIHALGALWLSLIALSSHAQALPPGVSLGMSARELEAAVPDLERVARPPRLAGGLSGKWRSPSMTLGGLNFEPIYYLAGDRLRRIEWVAVAEDQPEVADAAFGDIVQWGRSAFGPELASNDPGTAYAAWVDGDTDVYAQRTGGTARPTVRLVYRLRQVKDASEL